MTTVSPGLFACQQVSFATPFHGGHEVTVLASLGRSIKSPTRGNGGAIWVESVDQSGFKACILEYSDGSNNTAEVNWIATQSAPSGGKRGSISFGDWTTGTQCKIINFQQVSVLICIFFLIKGMLGAIHSTKIQTGPTGKRGPPQKVDQFFRNVSGWTERIH